MAGIFRGKMALVTGAGLSLERTTALAFAKEGARVFVADIDEGGEKRHGGNMEDTHAGGTMSPEI